MWYNKRENRSQALRRRDVKGGQRHGVMVEAEEARGMSTEQCIWVLERRTAPQRRPTPKVCKDECGKPSPSTFIPPLTYKCMKYPMPRLDSTRGQVLPRRRLHGHMQTHNTLPHKPTSTKSTRKPFPFTFSHHSVLSPFPNHRIITQQYHVSSPPPLSHFLEIEDLLTLDRPATLIRAFTLNPLVIYSPSVSHPHPH